MPAISNKSQQYILPLFMLTDLTVPLTLDIHILWAERKDPHVTIVCPSLCTTAEKLPVWRQ